MLLGEHLLCVLLLCVLLLCVLLCILLLLCGRLLLDIMNVLRLGRLRVLHGRGGCLGVVSWRC